MSAVVDELIALLGLERIEENLFRGQCQDLGRGHVYGGQVLGQALSAAVRTVPPERHVHSLNAYFLRPGDVSRPIIYDVDRIRDGGSFTTRRVVAIQNGQAIFNMAASFQVIEPGFEHQDPMPEAPPPESLPTIDERFAAHRSRLARELAGRKVIERPFDVRTSDPLEDPFNPTPLPPRRFVWLKTQDRLPDDPALHHYLLLYASDYAFVTTALLPHGISIFTPGMQIASLDHVMWFHRPCRVDEWLLYSIESPATQGARGLVRGSIFDQAGRLIATTAQEGLMRKRDR